MQTATKPQHLDMLNGPIWNKLPRYALPVAATGILGQLFNAADIAVVGNFTGDMRTAAVAAVGANSPVIGLLLNLFIGIALGANVVIANAIGRGDRETVHRAVHTSIVTALIGGVIVAVFGQFIAAGLMGLLNVPEDVYPLALAYLRIYLLGMPVILLYNFEAAIFRSVGDTKVPLIALTVSGVLNVILNLFFVIVLKMNVNGVAIATVLSNAVSSVLLLRRLLHGDLVRVELKQLRIDPAIFRKRSSRCRTSSSSRPSTASAPSSWPPRAPRSTSRSSPTTYSTPSVRPARPLSARTTAPARSTAAKKPCFCPSARTSSPRPSPS